MQRLAAIVGASGLALGSVVSLRICWFSALSLEHRIVIFLVGLGLFVLGGSAASSFRTNAAPAKAKAPRAR